MQETACERLSKSPMPTPAAAAAPSVAAESDNVVTSCSRTSQRFRDDLLPDLRLRAAADDAKIKNFAALAKNV